MANLITSRSVAVLRYSVGRKLIGTSKIRVQVTVLFVKRLIDVGCWCLQSGGLRLDSFRHGPKIQALHTSLRSATMFALSPAARPFSPQLGTVSLMWRASLPRYLNTVLCILTSGALVFQDIFQYCIVSLDLWCAFLPRYLSTLYCVSRPLLGLALPPFAQNWADFRFSSTQSAQSSSEYLHSRSFIMAVSAIDSDVHIAACRTRHRARARTCLEE
ncbi:hypothetical protein RRG08_015429 [Elysia crispata]|uniref:Uncharacterized protein n=1 Tax=Elysia crispata TaxID=231223 RepID=A0AAE0YH37_9GAST|nr:hypothetical protein RRG08_015429 [Elysia crispata]